MNGPDIGNGGGIVVDEPLEPTVQTPEVIQDPVNVTIDEGQNAEFFVAAEGTMPLVYQWQESTDGGGTWPNITNGGVYSGATTQHLVITAATAGMTTYQYRCRVTNAYGAATSAAAVLTVNAAATYFTLPPPIGVPAYVDLAEASGIIAAQTAGCLGFVELAGGGLLTSFTENHTVGTEFVMTVVGNPDNAPSCQARVWAAFDLTAGDTLSATIAFGSGPGADGQWNLYDSLGNLVDNQVSFVPSLVIPSTGQYILELQGTSTTPGFGAGSDTFDFGVSVNGAMPASISTIRAAYGGGPSYASCP